MAEGGIEQARRCVAKAASQEATAQAVGSMRSRRDDIERLADDKPLRIWPTACSERAVGAKILVYESDLDTARIKVCENLAPGAVWQAGPRRARMRFGQQSLGEFATLSPAPKIAVVEQPTDFGCVRDANMRN